MNLKSPPLTSVGCSRMNSLDSFSQFSPIDPIIRLGSATSFPASDVLHELSNEEIQGEEPDEDEEDDENEGSWRIF